MRIYQSTLSGILLSLVLTNVYAVATAPLLTNFADLIIAIENADDVKAIVHFNKCLLLNEKNQDRQTRILRRFDKASTRFNFTQFFHATLQIDDRLQDTVSTSNKSFVEQPSGEMWVQIDQLIVFDDNTATVHIDYFDLRHHKKQLEIDWLCNISNGSDNNGLLLYDFP